MTECNLVGVKYSELADQDLDRIVIEVHHQACQGVVHKMREITIFVIFLRELNEISIGD
jgi:hypothetical protein